MKNIYISCFFLFAFLITSCTDFVEKDISKKTVAILAPPDGYVTYSVTLTFWWQEIDGAENYSLQVVRPDFSRSIISASSPETGEP